MITLEHQPAIAVFAPSPVVTVTIEALRDDTADVHFHAGGQGFWIARMIRSLGGSVTLCAALGGETAVVLRSLIRHEGIDLREVPSQSWNGAYVHDRRAGARSIVAERAATSIARHELDALFGATLVTGIDAGTCVLTASVPSVIAAGTYERLTRDLRGNGVDVIVDTSGPCLAAALAGHPNLVKISHEELLRDGYARQSTVAGLLTGVRELQRRGAGDVVVSRAGDPALACLSGRFLSVACPPVSVIDHRGAGDAMTAALAVTRAAGMGDDDSLRLAVAAATLNVTRHGLATGCREDIEGLSSQVRVQPIRQAPG
jgi:1-phosphofructokinase